MSASPLLYKTQGQQDRTGEARYRGDQEQDCIDLLLLVQGTLEVEEGRQHQKEEQEIKTDLPSGGHGVASSP